MRRLIVAIRWLLSPDGATPGEQDLQNRVHHLEAQAKLDLESIERLEAQLRIRAVSIDEFAQVHERTLARIKAETAIEHMKAETAKLPQAGR